MSYGAAEYGEIGALLRELKETYGLGPLLAMLPDDLLTLLRKSVRDEKIVSCLGYITPCIREGLLPLVTLPESAWEQSVPKIVEKTGIKTGEVVEILATIRNELKIGRCDQIAINDENEPLSSWKQASKQPMLIAVVILSVVTGTVIASQVVAHKKNLEQRAKLADKQAKQHSQDAKKVDQRAESRPQETPAPPQLPAPQELPRPAIPTATADPDSSVDLEGGYSDATTSVENTEAPTLWKGCSIIDGSTGTPRAGNTWWPVVGPPEALQSVRQFCRNDAMLNSDGNTQIASFPNREEAESFAFTVTSEPRHPYSFYVGKPTVYN